ncbi:RHS repeat-associated core domain-containing protein [Bathymodiolus japonicus methanotrophic gill symbiont]|uniref:RHS repeat-associated core domain-containing protein n=1 Tax=Bathymodiolus japonicus methanotrophic gill symbiont TaxID=113269 RepID=UPI001C8D8B6C|nr:RHS repeat-associated core domain-containing protein [Bathymodiolus japonicus methanotrophic gill symbiont]
MAGTEGSFIDTPKVMTSNVYHMENRYYSDLLGRFLTTDRKKKVNGEYNYASANPLIYIDPTGNMPMIKVFEEVGEVIVALAATAVVPELSPIIDSEVAISEVTASSLTIDETVSASSGMLIPELSDAKDIGTTVDQSTNSVIDGSNSEVHQLKGIKDSLAGDPNQTEVKEPLTDEREGTISKETETQDKEKIAYEPKKESKNGVEKKDNRKQSEDKNSDDKDSEEKKKTITQKIIGFAKSAAKEVVSQGVMVGAMIEGPEIIKDIFKSSPPAQPAQKPL